jgi:glycosyltransferase involved in cell wall biosynthesis
MPEDARPILSIVTVCSNDLANVRRTIESLEFQSEQTGWEHILVDNVSDDGTAAWYQRADLGFPHHLISERDSGIFDAMNKSLAASRGDYIMFLNAGDRLADQHTIKRVLRRIETRPAWGYGRTRMVDSAGRQVRPDIGLIPYSRAAHLYRIAQICHQNVVMRLDFLRELGGFDLEMGNGADYHLLLKAAALESPATWPEIDIHYLVGGISDTQVYRSLWLGHRCRVDALRLQPAAARLDGAWTAMQVANIWIRKKFKPYLGNAYMRLRLRA